MDPATTKVRGRRRGPSPFPSRAAPLWRTLGAVFVVIDGPRVAVERLGGAAAVTALVENIYRGGWAAGSLQRHWESCLAIAARVPVLALERPRDLMALSSLAADVVACCRGLACEEAIAEPAGEPAGLS